MERPTFIPKMQPHSADHLAGVITADQWLVIEYTNLMKEHRKREKECAARGLPMAEHHRSERVRAHRMLQSLRKRAARSEDV